MDDSKVAPPRNASRTLVIALVAVLIVVAIAGIVLAGLRGRTSASGPASPSSPTQQGADGTTTTLPPPPVAAEAGASPNQVAFASASDTLTPVSLKKIADVALVAKKESHSVVIAARLEAGSEREQRMEMAKKRADAVRKALQAAGVSVNVIKMQISEYPPGLVSALDADRIELSMK